MLRSVKDLQGFSILATDGEIGKVHDIFFDADQWTVRYFVVETAPWLFGRKVLISPVAVQSPEWGEKRLPVNLTKDQVKDSPDWDSDRPVSRQIEIDTHDYYRWPYYWGGGGVMNTGGFIGVAPQAYLVGDADPGAPGDEQADVRRREQEGDPYLHSVKAVTGYKVAATDGDAGSVDDFLIDEDGWVVRYLVIDTGGLLQSGPKFLLAPPWIEYVSWQDSRVHVDLPRTKIEAAPRFEEGMDVDRAYEERLHKHYGLPEYWREPAEEHRRA